ncbi:Starch-binding associating with outer membrane [Catalinimonas alkaloidigena]|uniref:Starch-binding associating with outer membrane n=1 Tax=Catalinimonas alkaloidigena TaxID=1075417 RepID=A0A1G9QF32_9BACT|nr:RagB/SusD family nutrient uptake outer membrane protein [Catalinimonas alkaloidigena]SDM09500.1 Starch-binding associating with outer membrane [Catalinimonas alkaloidigena]
MKKYWIVLGITTLLFSCESVLEKNDLDGLNEQVWEDPELATLYLNRLYGEILPGFGGMASMSDETDGATTYMYGRLTTSGAGIALLNDYTKIRNLNTLFVEMDRAPDYEEKGLIEGQAYFLRAWVYFNLVKQLGGVPIVLEPQDPGQPNELYVTRDPTAATFEQVFADLDRAAERLPAQWPASDAGRITRGAALALKGRALLYWASPQFNPGNDAQRWQAAYEANKQALTELEQANHGLFPDFANLWFTEVSDGNPEAIFVKRFQRPEITHGFEGTSRPRNLTEGSGNGNRPTWDLVQAFPMANGLPIDDPNSGYDEDYYWKNRDPRFYATIVYNGAVWELANAEGVQSGRQQWTYQGAETPVNSSSTGFFNRKAVNVMLTPALSKDSDMDWIEIRFAEVMMNFAEAANEVGQGEEALTQLKRLRERAGIEPGADGNYGLAAGMSRDELFEIIVQERQVEFAFEAKRYWDLRRWRMFDRLNGTRRKGLRTTLKSGITRSQFEAIRDTVDLDNNYTLYFEDQEYNLDTQQEIAIPDSYYFDPISPSDIQKNPELEQTIGWDGGTFDPLQ